MSQVICHQFTKCNRRFFIDYPYVVDALYIDGPDDSCQMKIEMSPQR